MDKEKKIKEKQKRQEKKINFKEKKNNKRTISRAIREAKKNARKNKKLINKSSKENKIKAKRAIRQKEKEIKIEKRQNKKSNINNKNIFTWRKLDNSAKIFPLSTGARYSTVFRLSAVLKEEIDKKILNKAVRHTLSKYEFFQVRMKRGFFWYYLEHNNKLPIIEEEKEYPCKYINPETNNEYLFKVTYFKNKINIDIAHSLADGNSGAIFFKEMIYSYIELKYRDIFNENVRQVREIDFSEEDSYMKNFDKNSGKGDTSKKAYPIQGKKIKLEGVSVIHQIMDLQKLKSICEEKQATITQYLTAVLIYSIYMTNYQKSKKKNKKCIKVCVPVNLRKYYPSKTLSNFFSYITVECNMENQEMKSFDSILKKVKEEFVRKLNKEEISKTMSTNVKIGTNFFIKTIPLFLKKIIVRASYIEIRKYSTITFSNIGRMGIIGKYKDYIDYFMILLSPDPMEKIKCSACSFENKLVFTFTSILRDNEIEKFFYEFIKNHGIEIQIESNGVLNDISKETKC